MVEQVQKLKAEHLAEIKRLQAKRQRCTEPGEVSRDSKQNGPAVSGAPAGSGSAAGIGAGPSGNGSILPEATGNGAGDPKQAVAAEFLDRAREGA